MKKVFLLFALLVLSPSFAFALTTGEKAPEFSLKDIHGKKHALSQYQGKIVVLEWFNPECPFVKKHYESRNMQKLQKEFVDKGVVWLTVNSSAKGKQGYLDEKTGKKIFTDQNLAATTLLLDANGQVGKMYDAKTTPHMYVISAKGDLVYQGAIDNKPSVNPADIQGAENFVRKALNEAMSGKAIASNTTAPYGCSVKYE